MNKDPLAFASNNIIGLLFYLAHGATDLLSQQYQPYRLFGLQHAFLTVICRNPGISQKELRQWFALDLSNITRNLIHLEKFGYIRRERCENDKRGWLLYPTSKAEEIYPQIADIFDKTTELLTAHMTSEEKELLSKLLCQMQKNLKSVKKNQ